MLFGYGILPSIEILGIDASVTHLSMSYHLAFEPFLKRNSRLKINFSTKILIIKPSNPKASLLIISNFLQRPHNAGAKGPHLIACDNSKTLKKTLTRNMYVLTMHHEVTLLSH